jgi:hypothetical protein
VAADPHEDGGAGRAGARGVAARVTPADRRMEIGLVALLLLQLKHFVCDFVTQTQYQLQHKRIYGHPAGLLHAAHHVIGSAAALGLLAAVAPLPVTLALVATLLAAEFVLHYHIDWAKEQVIRPYVASQGPAYWAIFGFDQFLHHASYIAMAYILVRV